MSLRQRWQAFWSAEDLFKLVSSQAALLGERAHRIADLEAEVSAKPSDQPKPKSHGVVVTKVGINDKGESVHILDEYPDGEAWIVDGKPDEAWLNIYDGPVPLKIVSMGQILPKLIATYAPRTFIRVESGEARDIKEHKA